MKIFKIIIMILVCVSLKQKDAQEIWIELKTL